MTHGKGPSRRSMRARLAALARELETLHPQTRHAQALVATLRGEIPPDEAGRLCFAENLLTAYQKYDSEVALDLLFELTAPIVIEITTDILTDTLLLHREGVITRVLRALTQGDGNDPDGSGGSGSLQQRIHRLVDREASAALRRAREKDLLDDLFDTVSVVPAGPPAPGGTPFDLDRCELEELVARNFNTLPETTRVCFHMHLVEKLSLANIARHLGISIESVSRRMNEARRQAFALAAEYHRRKRDRQAARHPSSDRSRLGSGKDRGADAGEVACAEGAS